MSLIVTVQQKRKEFERKKNAGGAGGVKRSPSGVAPGATEPGTVSPLS